MLHRPLVCSALLLGAACQAPPIADLPPLEDEAIPASGTAVLAGGTAHEPVSEADAVLERLTAAYAFVGGEREQSALRQAIDAVVGDMSIFVRNIARNKLLDSNKIPHAIAIRGDGRKITVSFDDRSYTAEVDGPAVTVTGSQGDDLQLTHRLRGRRLIQNFKGERGSRSNTFTMDEGGNLKIDVTVQSPKLPKELRYRLSFGKQV